MLRYVVVLRLTSTVSGGSLCHFTHHLAVGNVHAAENLQGPSVNDEYR
jgi:hypothetical protein